MSTFSLSVNTKIDFTDVPVSIKLDGVDQSVTLDRGSRFKIETDDLSFSQIIVSILDGVPYAIDPDYSYSIEWFSATTGNYEIFDGVLSDDRKTLTFDGVTATAGRWGINADLNLNLYEVELTQVEDYPFIHVYDIKEKELNQLSKADIYSDVDGYFTVRGLDNYIVRLNRIPFNVTSEDPSGIQLGKSTLSIQANKISQTEQVIDLGKIRVPNRIHQEVGYKNIDVILYVPYFDPIPLETEYYLGSEISLSLTVNLLSGEATLNVYNSKLDHDSEKSPKIEGDEWVSYVKKSTVGDRIPFEVGERLDLNTEDTRLLTDYEVPYIEVKTLVPDNMVDYREIEVMEIDDNMDYLKSNKSYTNIRASKLEHEKIKQLLAKGVMIRK